MRCDIVQAKATGGNPEDEAVLTTSAETVGVTEDVSDLVNSLLITMKAYPFCVGLAAPQVGVRKRVAVAKVAEDEIIVLVNPVIHDRRGKKDKKRESCMSLWGYGGEVERRSNVDVEYDDENRTPVRRTFSGFAARVVQHEVDHLDGVLYRVHVSSSLSRISLFDGYSPTADGH